MGIQTCHVIPTYPQSNGKAESAVKSMKKIIEAAWAQHHLDKEVRALLQYRNTPSRRDGFPQHKLFGKPIQDTLPAHHRAFAPQWHKVSKEEDLPNDTPAERYYNQHAHTLPDITTGTNVAIQK